MTDYDRSRCGLPSQGTCVSSFRTNSSWVASKRLTAEDTTSTLLEARAWPCSSYPTSSFTESTFTTWSPQVRRWYEAATCAWDNGACRWGCHQHFRVTRCLGGPLLLCKWAGWACWCHPGLHGHLDFQQLLHPAWQGIICVISVSSFRPPSWCKFY